MVRVPKHKKKQRFTQFFQLKKAPKFRTYELIKSISAQKGGPFAMKDTNLNIHDSFFEAKNILTSLLQSEHGEVEALIHTDCFEVMRLVLQVILTNAPVKNRILTLYAMELENILINERIAHNNSILCLAK